MNTMEKSPLKNIADSELVDINAGEFLLLARYYSYETPQGLHCYPVQKQITAQQFYDLLHMVPEGSRLTGTVSDDLVQAFDQCLYRNLDADHGLWAFLSRDGRVIMQHST